VADGTILDGACARRPLSPQVGTKEWDLKEELRERSAGYAAARSIEGAAVLGAVKAKPFGWLRQP
jgi:hypothetical protein